MSVGERERHELHTRLDEVLGPRPAGTLMGYLPPVGWADVATKRDLELLENRLEAVIYRELSGLRGELATQTRTLFFSMSGLLLTVAGIAFAAARLG